MAKINQINIDNTVHDIGVKAENIDGKINWDKIDNKPSVYVPAEHTHDDRYYTETEINNMLIARAGDKGSIDVNTIFGNQYCAVSSTSANLPISQTGIIYSFNPLGKDNANYTVQLFFPWNSGFYPSYFRFYTNGSWYSWARMSTTKNSPHLKIKDHVWSNVVWANTSTTFTIPCPQIDGYRAIGIINVWVTYPETIEVPFYSLINSGTDILYKVRSTYGENLTNNTEFRILYAAEDSYAIV